MSCSVLSHLHPGRVEVDGLPSPCQSELLWSRPLRSGSLVRLSASTLAGEASPSREGGGVSGLQSVTPERDRGPKVSDCSEVSRTRRDTSAVSDPKALGFTPPAEAGFLRSPWMIDPPTRPLPVEAIRCDPGELPASRLCSLFEVRRVHRLLRPMTRSPSMGLIPLRGPVFVAGGSFRCRPGLAPGSSSRPLVGGPFGDRSLSNAVLTVTGEGRIVAWSPFIPPDIGRSAVSLIPALTRGSGPPACAVSGVRVLPAFAHLAAGSGTWRRVCPTGQGWFVAPRSHPPQDCRQS